MMDRNFGLILKENKGNQLEVELDSKHPERYAIPPPLWKLCSQGLNWLPPVKGKIIEEKFGYEFQILELI